MSNIIYIGIACLRLFFTFLYSLLDLFAFATGIVLFVSLCFHFISLHCILLSFVRVYFDFARKVQPTYSHSCSHDTRPHNKDFNLHIWTAQRNSPRSAAKCFISVSQHIEIYCLLWMIFYCSVVNISLRWTRCLDHHICIHCWNWNWNRWNPTIET